MGGDLIITGGMPLNGTVHIPAAKNSVLPLLAAALLCNGTVRFLQVPHLADVDTSVELLQGAGCTARWQGSDITVQGVPSTCRLAPEAAARMRASILFCAPLLARLGRVETVLPGGCRIGARPVDLHLSGLAQMGVHCREEGERLILTAPAGLHGADITLGFPSVGATETLLLAAAAAQGETVLRGAAREPEISDLAAFLNRCGGCVQGAGTSTIRVQGRRMLYSCSFAPMADRTVLILGIGAVLMFVGGTGLKWFVLAGAGGAAAIGAAIIIMPDLVPYAASRLSSWLDPFADPLGDGHQTIQSLYAIGSGGAAGLGLGSSRQKHLFVPEPQNDFIFSILCEELGFVGACAVILLFALLLWRGITLAAHAPDRFGALLVVGFVVQVALQAVLNMAVVTNTIPNTGISLPFFSSGGTSLMMLLGEMGIVLSVSRGET